MKINYKIFLIILLAVFVVPQIALAAWWNPFSWGIWNRIFHFQKTEQQVQKQKQQNKSSVGEKDMLSDVYPLFSNLKWGNVTPKKNQEIIGYEITAKATVDSLQSGQDFFNFYDTKLKQIGWVVANNFAADGVTGSQIGFKKGNNYIVLGYNLKYGKIISKENEPLQGTCPCTMTYTIFTTPPTQTTNETANWKTYTSDKYGFEIKYPNNSEFNNDNTPLTLWGGSEQIIVNNVLNIDNDPSSNIGAVVKIMIGENKKSVDNCLKFNFYDQLENMKNTYLINGAMFNTYSQGDAAMGGQRGLITQYSIVKNNICYALQTQTHWSDISFVHGATDGKKPTKEEIDEQNKQIKKQEDFVESIISTFKFTK